MMRLYLLSTGLSAMLRENRLVSRELALTPIPRQGAKMRHAERVCSMLFEDSGDWTTGPATNRLPTSLDS